MTRYLFRLAKLIPLPRRLELVLAFNRISERSRVVGFIWNKIVLRLYYLHGVPRGLTVELTDRCNLKCTYCPKSLDIGVKGRHMEWDLFIRAVDGALTKNELDVINLVGFGEPLLYPRLGDAIRYIKTKSPRTRVCLTTNGTMLDRKKAIELIESGMDQITISVNATSRDQYRRINAADEYDRVVKNTIDFLDAANRSGRAVTVFVQVLSIINDEEQINQFREFWRPHLGKCGIIQIQPFVNWAGQIDTADILKGESAAREIERHSTSEEKPSNLQHGNGNRAAKVPNSLLLRALKSRKRTVESPFAYDSIQDRIEPYPCYHLHKSRIISREGNALACCMVFPDNQGDLGLGNLKDKTFAELYGGKRARELQQMDFAGRLGELTPCNTCNAWKTVPNIWWRNPFHRWFGPKWL